MAGKRIGDYQVSRYKKFRKAVGQEVAATKVGISVASARRIDAAQTLPSQRPARGWRTRSDPFEGVWDTEVVPLLKEAPSLTAMTLLEEMQRRHPGEYADHLLRTLQRRVRAWCASFGAEREVFFEQAHPPGRLGLSDFTHAALLRVTVGGSLLLHLLYQFVLAYSGWRYVEVVLTGESFAALSSGLQNAVWMMGGVPEEHRTDSLSAAFNNHAEHVILTSRYEGLCADYGMRPSRNNLGMSHENGSVEARQGTLKRTMEQALLLRGHRDFEDLGAYRQFVAEVTGRMNRRVNQQFTTERALLLALPPRRSSEYEEVEARVTKFATLSVKKVLYSAPSRLVGHRLKIRVYVDRLECWLGRVCVLELHRGQPGPGARRGKVVDYRHLLPALKRKPGAFARSALRDEMFPRSEYRQMWERLRDQLPEAAACKMIVGLLDLAGNGGCEAELAERLALLLRSDALPDLEQLKADMAPRSPQYPDVRVDLPELARYDELLEVVA